MSSEIKERIRISGGDLLQELANIVTSDIRNYIDWDNDGPTVHSSESLTPAQAKAIQSIKFKTVERITGPLQMPIVTRTTEVEFKLWNKLDAARQLIELYSLQRTDPDEEGRARVEPPIPMNLQVEASVITDALIAAQRAGLQVVVPKALSSPNGAVDGHQDTAGD